MSTQIAKPAGPFFKEPRIFPKRGPNNFPIGARAERRAKENRELGKLDIRRCEIRIPGVCVDRIMLTWMHSKKSRFLLTSKDWQEAARACQPCHQYGEDKGHKFMKRLVTEAIKRRAK